MTYFHGLFRPLDFGKNPQQKEDVDIGRPSQFGAIQPEFDDSPEINDRYIETINS